MRDEVSVMWAVDFRHEWMVAGSTNDGMALLGKPTTAREISVYRELPSRQCAFPASPICYSIGDSPWEAVASSSGHMNPPASERSGVSRFVTGPWFVFFLASTALWSFAFWVLRTLRPATDSFRVFGSFWASGYAAGHHLDPYIAYPLTWKFPLAGYASLVPDLNLNPPPFLPLLEVFSWSSPKTGFIVWTVISVMLFTGVAAWLVREYELHLQKRQVLWLLLAWAVFHTLWLGQDYAFFFALAAGAWVLLDRNRLIAAGVCMGVLTAMKPNFGLWPFLLLLTGRTRLATAAGCSFLACNLLSLVLYSPLVYTEWFHALAVNPHWMFSFEVSLTGLATRLGHRPVGEAASVALVLFSCIFVPWKRPSARQTSGIAICVAILASPLAWFHYSLLLAGPLLRIRWGWFLSLALLPLMLPLHGIFYFVSILAITAHFFWDATSRPSFSR